MGSSFVPEPAYRRDAKEYARFRRLRGLFFVDGLDVWRITLKTRGLTDEDIGRKMAAAARFVRNMGDQSTERKDA